MIKKAKIKMNKKLICIAPTIYDMVSIYQEKFHMKSKFLNVGIPVFNSIELTTKALNHMNSYREFLEKKNIKYK